MRASRLLTTLLLVPASALAQASAASKAPSARATAEATAVQPAPTAQAPAPASPATDSDEPKGVDLSAAAQQLEDGSEAPPPAASPEAPSAAPAAPATAAAPDLYTVQRGDTLWDLSGRFLNNPWYWPKVWSYNPEIANPHFIYPGNHVRFFPGAEGGATRVEPATPLAVAPVPEEEDADAPRELEDFSRADMKKPQELGEGDEVAVVGPYRIGYVAPKGTHVRRDGMVTPLELAESGTIVGAFDEKVLLSFQDKIYVKFADPGKVKVGETYLIYKTLRQVKHPVTQENFGFQTSIVGAVKVTAIDDTAVTGLVTEAYEPIERGDRIGPWSEKLVKQVQRRANQKDLAGYIVAARSEILGEIGEYHVVFVDKGRQDGVEEGNTFDVVRSGDPRGLSYDRQKGQRDLSLPKESIGTLLVIEVQQNASTALVVRSIRELAIGDHVEMKPVAANRVSVR